MIYRTCPEYDPSNALVQPLMTHVDCRVETIIASAHQGIFGQFGQFGFLLTGCLTIVVAFYGFRLLIGAAQLSLTDIVPKLLLMGGLVAVVSSWSLFNLLFFSPFYASGEGLAFVVLDGFGLERADSVYGQLDAWIASAVRLSNDIQPLSATGGLAPPPIPTPVQPLGQTPPTPNTPAPLTAGSAKLFLSGALPKGLLWTSTIIAAFCSAGLMVTSKIIVGCLLAMGPLILVGVLFEATRGIFIGWLRFMARIGFLQLLTVLFTAGLMQIQLPLLQKLELLTLNGDQSQQILIAMLLISLIFAALVTFAAFASKALADGIRWPEPLARPIQAVVDHSTAASDKQPSTAQQRIGSIVAAVETGQTSAAAPSTTVTRTIKPAFEAPPQMREQPGMRKRSDSIASAFDHGGA